MFNKPSDYNKKINISFDITLKYFYFMDIEHPLANKYGKVYYHRHIASLKEGRWITGNEHVHHIDEDKSNNEFNNLKLLTAKEHAQIHALEKGGHLKEEKICPSCKEKFLGYSKQIYCNRNCINVISKLSDLTKEQLLSLLYIIPVTKIAAFFNVSDTAIKKRCKKFNLNTPERGYWAK